MKAKGQELTSNAESDIHQSYFGYDNKKYKMNTLSNNIVEAFTISGNWGIQSKQLKKKFKQLTDDDLIFESGHEIDLLNKLEEKLNKKKKQIVNIINNNRFTRFRLL